MIKITYNTFEKKSKREEKTEISIFNGRMFIKYNIPNKAKTIVGQMIKDGKKGVLYSRGMIIQSFPKKTENEILEIVKEDIKNGIYTAKEKTKKELTIKNYQEKYL